MRAALLLLSLPGCLAAPADGLDQADGGAASGDAISVGCVTGSTLDLAYVSRIAVVSGVSTELSLAGMAVFINPGQDTIVLPQVTATAVGGNPHVIASAGVEGGEAGLVLASGEAKGALADAASPVVRSQFGEAWNDTASPSLLESFLLSDPHPDEQLWGEIAVPIQVQAGDYALALVVTLVDDGSREPGTALAAARATATCE